MNYTYILKCKDDTLYTGWTNNLQKRVEDHNAGKGAKYTKFRRPVEIIYYEAYKTKQEAMKREYAIKQLSRREKLLLIEKIENREKEYIGKINDKKGK
ncbi:MAG: GIY-YIG nuclease family protein [Schaedlerella sp.]|nr:GIY-YIG nuclease family protein [Schaedlerella sp.]